MFFLVDQVLASQIKTEEETWIMGYWSPISDTQVRIHSAQQDSKIIFTSFSLFFGGPGLSITDQDWEET